MPLLDVSDVLSDPDFADSFTVTRITETVDGHGRAQSTRRTYPASGVVTSDKGDVLLRTPEGQRVTGSIMIHTPFRIQAKDEITWAGQVYTAANPNDYSRYGSGFVSVICDLKQLS